MESNCPIQEIFDTHKRVKPVKPVREGVEGGGYRPESIKQPPSLASGVRQASSTDTGDQGKTGEGYWDGNPSCYFIDYVRESRLDRHPPMCRSPNLLQTSIPPNQTKRVRNHHMEFLPHAQHGRDQDVFESRLQGYGGSSMSVFHRTRWG